MGGHFDLEVKETQIKKLEEEINSENVWENVTRANEINRQISTLKKIVGSYNATKENLNYYKEILEISNQDEINMINEELSIITKNLDELEINTLLSKEYDENNCYLEIHPGAGGTESCDWSSMLMRMYQRFCDKEEYSCEVLDLQKGDEAGIKSVTLHIKGLYAYGYLKCEKGVHRLVRISPFDSNARRHTSFASVTVIPEIDNNVSLEINEVDLKIDVYHSSGAGGQSVNTSNSAVRITHIPTNTIVTCQNERSQMKNKEEAMKVLKSKLYQIELEKKEKEINALKGVSENINFGSQIRSYVLEPYKMVKDSRSNYETSQADKILDGNIKELIESVLRTNK